MDNTDTMGYEPSSDESISSSEPFANYILAADLNHDLSLDLNSIEFFKAFYEEEGSSPCQYYNTNNSVTDFKNSVSNFLILSNND